jgi:hypothetical protein
MSPMLTLYRSVDRTEAELHGQLQKDDCDLDTLEALLAKFRSACQDLVFLDYDVAARGLVESRLWAAHGRVNSKFRPRFAYFRSGEGQKKKVEHRKLDKVYIAFIKSSQRFYRGYIQRVASNFTDVPEIFGLAADLKLDGRLSSLLVICLLLIM